MNKLKINIIHLGPGKVGKEFINQIIQNKNEIERNYNTDIKFIGVINSLGAIYNTDGLDLKKLIKEYLLKPKKYFNKDNKKNLLKALKSIKGVNICIDTSASDETFDFLYNILKNKGYVIMSNKIPLSVDNDKFNKIFKYKNNIFFETTVGAGLPVISSVKELLETGDKITKIEGVFSGTLSYIFSSLEKDSKYSEAVLNAHKLGYTEPDPRDDLSGKDFARKMLILSRLIGKRIELKNIKIENLYPTKLNKVAVDEFLKKLPDFDKKIDSLVENGKKKNKVLRYSANIGKNSSLKLKLFNKDSEIGTLKDTENIFIINTKRYGKNKIVIKGPGAGLTVTAAGVFGDLIKVLKILK